MSGPGTEATAQTRDLGSIPRARGFWARARGLLGADDRRLRRGLVLPRCTSVHTFGMRRPIDVLFVDADGRVVEVQADVGPGRLVRGPAGARDVIELAAGAAAARGVEKGCRVRWTAS